MVRRGEVVLDFDVIDNWNNELDNNNNNNMNNGKEGASWYPYSFVQLLGYYMREFIFYLPYRQKTEGVVKAHSNKKVPSVPDSTVQ